MKVFRKEASFVEVAALLLNSIYPRIFILNCDNPQAISGTNLNYIFTSGFGIKIN